MTENEKKNIVILTHVFPPHAHVGGRRAYYFAKYLSLNGYNVTIITSDLPLQDKKIWEVDTSFLNIHKVKLKKLNLLKSFFKKIIELQIPFISKNFYRLSRIFFELDYDNRIDVKSIINLLPNTDIIFATGGPWYIFEEAIKLKEQLNCKLILDYRDAWNVMDKNIYVEALNNHGKGYYGKLLLIKNIKIERKCIENSNLIITISQPIADNIKLINSTKKVELIYNGYDLNEKIKLDRKEFNNEFKIVYAGNIYKEQDLSKLAIALRFLKLNHIRLYKHLKFIFIGGKVLNNTPIFQLHKFSDIIEITDIKSRKEVLEYYQKANLLLHVSHQGRKGMVSSKIFQYLIQDKPILLISNTDDIIERIVKETNTGFICKSSKDIINALMECYNHWEKNLKIPFRPNKSEIEKYSFENLTKKLIKILEHDI